MGAHSLIVNGIPQYVNKTLYRNYNTLRFSILIFNKSLQFYVKKGPVDGVFKRKLVERLDK